MLRNQLLIDGKDAFTTWGVYAVKGGVYDLLTYPPLKAPEYNDWHEEDGIEVDLSAPQLDAKEVQLKVAFNKGASQFYALIALLADGAYHTLTSNAIGQTYRLRYVGVSDLRVVENIGTATLKMVDDFPLRGYVYAPPTNRLNLAYQNGYTLDGQAIEAFGIKVLQGSLDKFRESLSVKSHLTHNGTSHAGIIYYASPLHYESKEVTLQCLLRAYDLTEFWRNYHALLYRLTRPNERLLHLDAPLRATFALYYKSSTIEHFDTRQNVWCKFTLTFTLMRGFRLGG